MNPGTLSVLGMLAGLGIDIMDALPRRSQSARHARKNDGTTDEEKSAAVKRGPVRCPFYSEHERCRVARGTGPDLFARHYCDRTDGASWAWVRR